MIFAVYALVLMPSLVLFGQLSDRLGRRRVVTAGLIVQIVALIVFATAPRPRPGWDARRGEIGRRRQLAMRESAADVERQRSSPRARES